MPSIGYNIQFDSFTISRTRAFHKDTVYVSTAYLVGLNESSPYDANPKTTFMGNLNNGTYTMWSPIGSASLSDTDILQIAFAIVNMGDRSYPNIIDILNQMIGSTLATGVETIDIAQYDERLARAFSLTGNDGACAADKFVIKATELDLWTRDTNSWSVSKGYDGIRPDSNSSYSAAITIKRQ